MNSIIHEMSVIEVTQFRNNGTPSTQRLSNLCQLDETLQLYFKIGATSITIKYPTGETEYILIPQDNL